MRSRSISGRSVFNSYACHHRELLATHMDSLLLRRLKQPHSSADSPSRILSIFLITNIWHRPRRNSPGLFDVHHQLQTSRPVRVTPCFGIEIPQSSCEILAAAREIRVVPGESRFRFAYGTLRTEYRSLTRISGEIQLFSGGVCVLHHGRKTNEAAGRVHTDRNL